MRVETVRGAMAVDGLGTAPMHEHVFVLTPDVMQNYGHEWWDEQDRVADAVRQLQARKVAGVDSTTVAALAKVGYADRMVLAHDASCCRDFYSESYKTALLPRWNYTHITDDVLSALREHGVDEAQITAMSVHNPARYFTGGQE